MGREIIFWKLNPKKAKNLIDFLDNIEKPLEVVKGEELLQDISKVKYSNPAKYNEINEKIKQDINLITLEELNLITAYFYLFGLISKPSVNYSSDEEKYYNRLRDFGIEYIDEIPSKTPANEFALTFGNSEGYLKNRNFIFNDHPSKYYSSGLYGDSSEIMKNIKFVDYCAKRMILEIEKPDKEDKIELIKKIKMLSQDKDLELIFNNLNKLKIPFKDLHEFDHNMEHVSWITTNVLKQIKNYKGRLFIEDNW